MRNSILFFLTFSYSNHLQCSHAYCWKAVFKWFAAVICWRNTSRKNKISFHMILTSRKLIYRSSFLDVFGVWLPFLPFVPMSDWGGLHAGSGSLHSGGAEVLPLRAAVHPRPVPVQDPRRVQHSTSLQCLPAGRLWQPRGHLLLKGQRSWCTSPQLMSLWVMIFSQ